MKRLQSDWRLAAALAAATVCASPAPAQPAGDPGSELLRQRDRELEAARSEQKKATENEKRLRGEIEALGEDRRKLNQALIDTAARVRQMESRLAENEARIEPLQRAEQTRQAALEERRAELVEVLAVLQRVGRRPPAALLATPEDALQSIRTAMLVGAVLPDMRARAAAIAAELSELVRVRKELAAEKDRLGRDLAAMADERRRMTLLAEERRSQQADAERALEEERRNAVALARQVDNLKDLIARMEQGLDSAARAARAAAAAGDRKAGERPNLAALSDPGRLAPAIAFSAARGHLPLPVNGVKIREYGAPDGVGGTEKGISVATRAGAQVTSPADGWVVYAGPFRSFGQLLILNAGGGYHVVLAGMERISVDLGQFVLTGEPVAVMGTGAQLASQVAAAVPIGSRQPVLYVEFRKDGVPVDPGPWWAATKSEKVRG